MTKNNDDYECLLPLWFFSFGVMLSPGAFDDSSNYLPAKVVRDIQNYIPLRDPLGVS
jgi:hypothetical protein